MTEDFATETASELEDMVLAQSEWGDLEDGVEYTIAQVDDDVGEGLTGFAQQGDRARFK